ncbi:MAG: hypothetical protein GF330_10150 [Candidatus Eisenbacteria bacterium]|nr:hypothetical protein [Candidatus Eisenbacteria bacterium]
MPSETSADGARSRPSRAGAFWPPVLFVLVLLLLRSIFLLGACDPSQERVVETLAEAQAVADAVPGAPWPSGPERPLYDREELYCGTAAEAIRMELGVPLPLYRFMSYGGGSLLTALLAVPLYEIGGAHYLTFKILGLLVTLVGGLFWFLTVRSWLGERAGRWFALLYLFGPPLLVRTALIAKGDHPEAMAILGVVAYLATRAARSAPHRITTGWAAASGLVAGLAVWVTYSIVPGLVGFGLAAWLRSRLRPLRLWAAFLAGLALGLVPWVLWVVRVPDALELYGEGLGAAAAAGEALARLRLLLQRGWMAGYELPGAGLRAMAGYVWLTMVLIGWVVLVRRRREPSALLLLSGTAVMLVAFLLGAPDASSRYLLPLYPLLLIAVLHVAIGNRRRAGAWRRRVAGGALLLLAAAG